MSDPTLSDIDLKNEMAWVWTTLNFLNSATGLGAVTIDTAGRSQGFYIDENIGYDIYTNLNGVSYRRAALSYPKKCKEYFEPPTGHEENNVLRRKRRNADKSEYKILGRLQVRSGK